MIAVHVNTFTGESVASCSLCPSWGPTFDDEAKAWEIATRHDEVAHGAEPDQLPTPATYVDLVLAVRVGMVEDEPSLTPRIEWLAETLGELIRNTMANPKLREHIGMTFDHQVLFAKLLPPDRLQMAFTPDEVQYLTDNWRNPE